MRRTIDVPRIRFFRVKKQPIDINQTFTRVFLHKNEEKTTTYQEILYLCRGKTGSAYSNVSTQNNKTKTTQRNQQIKTTQQKQRNNNQNENHKSNYQL